MVVDHVEDDRQTLAVGSVDEVRQVERRAVGRFRRKERGRVIAPGTVHRELVDRQRLDAVEAHFADVGELALDVLEVGTRLVELVAAAGEAPDVELIDDEVFEARAFGTAPRGTGSVPWTTEPLRSLGSDRVSSELSTSRAAGSDRLVGVPRSDP